MGEPFRQVAHFQGVDDSIVEFPGEDFGPVWGAAAGPGGRGGGTSHPLGVPGSYYNTDKYIFREASSTKQKQLNLIRLTFYVRNG